MINFNNLVESIIDEAATSTLYHFTPIRDALKILKDNKFKLSTNILDKVEMKLQKEFGFKHAYYMSTSRSKQNDYINVIKPPLIVCFTLDGNKFNDKHFKTLPVNYFYFKNPNKSYKNELEDRLVHDEPSINNFNDYITKVDIISKDHGNELSEDDWNYGKDIMKFCKDNNIDYDFYNSIKNFNKKEATAFPKTFDDNNIYLPQPKENMDIDQETRDTIKNLTDIVNQLPNRKYKGNKVLSVDFELTILNNLSALADYEPETFHKFVLLLKKMKLKNWEEFYDYITKLEKDK